MKRLKLIVLLIVPLLFVSKSCSSNSFEESRDSQATLLASDLEMELLQLVNDYRLSKGLNKLKFDNNAYDFAILHTDSMIAKGAICHENFHLRSSQLSLRTGAWSIAENVGRGFLTARGIFNGLKESPKHLKNMEGDFTHTAISAKPDNAGTLYFTQLFYK